MQVGAFGSLRTHYTKRQDGSSLRDLVEYCRELYPASHPVSLVRSGGDDRRPVHVRQVSLANLGDVTQDDVSGASLYIPPSEEAIPNKDFIAKMEQA
jgi:hypothetical protein